MIAALLSAVLAAPSVHVEAPGDAGWLTDRLRQEGYEISADAPVDLTVERDPEVGWIVTATGATSERFVVAAAQDEAITRLELLHRAIDALEAVEPRAPEAADEPDPEPEPARRPEATDDELPPRDPPHTAVAVRQAAPALVIRGGAGIGTVLRALRPDLDVTGSLFFGLEPGPSFWADLQVWSSTHVVEIIPAIGLRLRAMTRGRFSLDFGGLVGLYAQRYNFATPGVIYDVSGEGAGGFAIRMWGEHEFFALVRAGGVGNTVVHQEHLDVIWWRVAWRFAVTLGVTFGRRLRR